MFYNLLLVLLHVAFWSCHNDQTYQTKIISADSIVQDDCDHPDAAISCCFANQPNLHSATLIIPTKPEDGSLLRIKGKVLKADRMTPYANVLIYAYHTDQAGYYSKSGNESGIQKWHGRLHGWCKTDTAGNYEIQTIRPAPYPSNTMPAHIHLAIQKPDGTDPFYINDMVFEDDDLVTPQYVKTQPYSNGGSGVVQLSFVNSVWQGHRDIVLK